MVLRFREGRIPLTLHQVPYPYRTECTESEMVGALICNLSGGAVLMQRCLGSGTVSYVHVYKQAVLLRPM